MGRILRIAFRQLDAVRHQVLNALGPCLGVRGKQRFVKWLTDNAPQLLPYFPRVEEAVDRVPFGPAADYCAALHSLIESYQEGDRADPTVAGYLRESWVSTSQSDHAEEDDFGTHHGGAWDEKQFILRSGLVMSLAATESFERGLIRGLIATQSSLPDKGRSPIVLTLADVTNCQSPRWKDLEGGGEIKTCRGRKQILQELGVHRHIETELFDRLNAAWQDRNDIVHGWAPVKVSLDGLLGVQYTAYSYMRQFAEATREQLGVEV